MNSALLFSRLFLLFPSCIFSCWRIQTYMHLYIHICIHTYAVFAAWSFSSRLYDFSSSFLVLRLATLFVLQAAVAEVSGLCGWSEVMVFMCVSFVFFLFCGLCCVWLFFLQAGSKPVRGLEAPVFPVTSCSLVAFPHDCMHNYADTAISRYLQPASHLQPAAHLYMAIVNPCFSSLSIYSCLSSWIFWGDSKHASFVFLICLLSHAHTLKVRLHTYKYARMPIQSHCVRRRF